MAYGDFHHSCKIGIWILREMHVNRQNSLYASDILMGLKNNFQLLVFIYLFTYNYLLHDLHKLNRNA